MPFSVAAQRGIYMVVYGVTQKDIQLIVFDRANMSGDIIPQDPVALLNVGILQGQIVLICGGLGLRPGAPPTPAAVRVRVNFPAGMVEAFSGRMAIEGF